MNEAFLIFHFISFPFSYTIPFHFIPIPVKFVYPAIQVIFVPSFYYFSHYYLWLHKMIFIFSFTFFFFPSFPYKYAGWVHHFPWNAKVEGSPKKKEEKMWNSVGGDQMSGNCFVFRRNVFPFVTLLTNAKQLTKCFSMRTQCKWYYIRSEIWRNERKWKIV